MESFPEWAAWALGEAVPGLALHDALKYALKYWPYVMNVLEDGRLGLDNNIALPPFQENAQFPRWLPGELALRPFLGAGTGHYL